TAKRYTTTKPSSTSPRENSSPFRCQDGAKSKTDAGNTKARCMSSASAQHPSHRLARSATCPCTMKAVSREPATTGPTGTAQTSDEVSSREPPTKTRPSANTSTPSHTSAYSSTMSQHSTTQRSDKCSQTSI